MEQNNKSNKLVTPFIWQATVRNNDGSNEIIKQFDENDEEISVKILENKDVREIKLISLLTNSHNFVMKLKSGEKYKKFWRRRISIIGEQMNEYASEVLEIHKEVNDKTIIFRIIIPNSFYDPIEIYTIEDGDKI